MPTIRPYSGIKTCQDAVQRIALISSATGGSCRTFVNTQGQSISNLYMSYYNSNVVGYTNRNKAYLDCDYIVASTDSYDASDYLGTNTGTVTFTKAIEQTGVKYNITFTPSATGTIKCLKFFKNLVSWYNSEVTDKRVLMFGVFFDDDGLNVEAGKTYHFSVWLSYDE